MKRMFKDCRHLKVEYLKDWDLSSIVWLEHIFKDTGIKLKDVPENFRIKAEELGQKMF